MLGKPVVDQSTALSMSRPDPRLTLLSKSRSQGVKADCNGNASRREVLR